MKRTMYITASVSLMLMFLFFFIFRATQSDIFSALCITSMTICFHFTARLVIGTVLDAVKPARFDPKSAWFRERSFERRLFGILRIKALKKYAPTYDDKQFSLKDNTGYELAQASCRAELVHILCAVASLSTIFFSNLFGETFVFAVTAVFGALIDLFFVLVQRYNRPRFLRHNRTKNG